MIIWILITALIWGITNPLLKKTSIESTSTASTKATASILSHLYSLITAWKFILTQLMNWCGTISFLKALSQNELTVVVPVTNALTFVITEITDSLLFNSRAQSSLNVKLRVYGGMMLVCFGTYVCMV
jgi:hypothetical protein